MRYDHETLKPRKPDEHAVDAFVDWYGARLAGEPLLLKRPDRDDSTNKAVDGVYELCNLCMAVEHTSLDEVPKRREHGEALKIVRAKFEGVPTPRKECRYIIYLPHSFPARKDAERIADELALWFTEYGHLVRADNHRRPAPHCRHEIQIVARESVSGAGKVYLIPTVDDNQLQAIDKNTTSEIERCLEKKLPKLAAHQCEGKNTIRILVIQNDEFGWVLKEEYEPTVRQWMDRKDPGLVEEIWAMEHIGSDADCTLLWCRQLDQTTGRSPFSLREMGLAPVSALRDLSWIRCRMLQVENSHERRAVLDEIEDRQAKETSPELCYGTALEAIRKLRTCITAQPPPSPSLSDTYGCS